MRRAPKWDSEAAMLAAFRVQAEAAGFRCVPEAGGHDMLLVATRKWEEPPDYIDRRTPLPPPLGWPFVDIGDIIAVQGKLHATPTLLRQALPPHRQRWWGADDNPSPAADFYLAVIPRRDADFCDVAEAVDVGVCAMLPPDPGVGRWDARPARIERVTLSERHRVVGYPRIEVTALDVDIAAGSPSPRALTPWKEAAVRLCMAASDGRELRVADFTGPLRARTFVDRGWVRLVRRDGRAAVWVLADGPGRPDVEYPEIVEAIRRQEAR